MINDILESIVCIVSIVLLVVMCIALIAEIPSKTNDNNCIFYKRDIYCKEIEINE